MQLAKLQLRTNPVVVLLTLAPAFLFLACTTSYVCKEGHLATAIKEENALLVFVNEESEGQLIDVENDLLPCLSDALKKLNSQVRVVGPEEVCSDVGYPVHSAADILERLLHNSQFRDRIGVEAVQYVLLVGQDVRSSGWHNVHWDFLGSLAGYSYRKRDIERTVIGTIVDVEMEETRATLKVTRWASSGAGIVLGAQCLIFPIGWIGIDDEELALEEFCRNIAKFLLGRNVTATPCDIKTWRQ